MKRVLFVLLLAAVVPGALFAQFSSRDFELTYEGNALTKPIDLKKLQNAVVNALANRGWQVLTNEDGEATAKFEKDGGKVSATILVKYSEEGYSITYMKSKGLDYDKERRRIHSNYIKWVRNLVKDISVLYMKM